MFINMAIFRQIILENIGKCFFSIYIVSKASMFEGVIIMKETEESKESEEHCLNTKTENSTVGSEIPKSKRVDSLIEFNEDIDNPITDNWAEVCFL